MNRFPKYLAVCFVLLTTTINAQFFFFGRNKVQYEEFNWKVLKTEHFDIYYYEEFEELAEIGAGYAEKAFEHHKVTFNHIVTRRIPLIFYNTLPHFQQTNVISAYLPEGVGGFFEHLKGRVVVPLLTSLSEFERVITHEMVHVYMTDKIFRSLTDHRLPTTRRPPLWFEEGLSDYLSYQWDTQGQMIMRDAVLNNFFIGLENMNRIGGYVMYKFGQNFMEFVAHEYGRDKIFLTIDNFWRFSTFNEVLEFTLGEDVETIGAKWDYYVKQRYFPLMENKFPHSIKAKKITNEGFNFSPSYYEENDSTRSIYFIANRDGYTSVYKQSLDKDFKPNDDAEKIIQGERDAEFEAFHLTLPSLNVSKDGLVAIITKSGGTDALHLYSIEEDEVIKTYQYSNLLTMQGPRFSNDGKRLAFVATDKKGFTDVFILNLETEELERITNDYYFDKDPVFDKDDKTIIFSSDRTEGIFEKHFNLFSYDLDTHKMDYLTYVKADISTPHFTPDFKDLYFGCDYDGTLNIYKLDRDDNDQPIGMTQYTQFVTSIYDFTFTTDSNIITTAFEKFSFQFYELNLDAIPDSLKTFVGFNFNFAEEKWEPKPIDFSSVKERLQYENTYTLDYAFSQFQTDPVYGSRGGALMALSDLLGNDRYIFMIYNTAEVQSEILKNFNVAISRINLKQRTNYGYGIFHYSGRRYDIRESEKWFYERSYGGYFSLLYPFSFFERLEASITIANSDKDVDTEPLPRKSLLLTNSLSFIHDNSIWGPTGPMDGSRLRILLGYTSDIRNSNVNYYSFIFDYRHYFRTSQRTAIAARGALFVNNGKRARRYFAGGSWDLRGWPRWSIRGEKMWLSSVEFRFPLIDYVAVRLPFFGLAFANIRGAAFFDAGSAWDKEYKQTLGSVGVGFRMNLFNAITFRYDVGKKIEDDFGRFQPKLFYQFFFGWDF